jgi:hypothetical protein
MLIKLSILSWPNTADHFDKKENPPTVRRRPQNLFAGAHGIFHSSQGYLHPITRNEACSRPPPAPQGPRRDGNLCPGYCEHPDLIAIKQYSVYLFCTRNSKQG